MSNIPNPERKETTMAVLKEDKKEARKYATATRNMRSGTKYETDSEIFHKFLEFYKKNHTPLHSEAKRTYPVRPKDPTAVVVETTPLS